MKQEVIFKFETKDKTKIVLNGEDARAIWEFLNNFYNSSPIQINYPAPQVWPSWPHQYPYGTWITCNSGTSGSIEIK